MIHVCLKDAADESQNKEEAKGGKYGNNDHDDTPCHPFLGGLSKALDPVIVAGVGC